MNLRTITVAAALAILASANPAHATGNHTPPKPKEPPSKPTPTPAPPAQTPVYVGGSPSTSAASSTSGGGRADSASVSGAQSGSNASSGANANAAGGAGGTASATGAAAAGDSTSGATLQDSSSFWSQSRALGLTFAPGAFTPPMAPVQCASATITQSARGLGVGLLSRADSKTDSSDCVLINLRNAMVAACKFESAKQVEDLLVQKHLPKFEPSKITYLKDNNDPGFVDYSPTQCALLTSPLPKPAEPTALNWIYIPPPVARVEDKPAEPVAAPTPPTPPAPPAPKRKPTSPAKSIGTKPSTNPGTTLNCGDDGVPQCVAKSRKPLALGGSAGERS